MNFIDAFLKKSKNSQYVLHFMNYFNRFFVVVIILSANVETVISTLKYIFNIYQKSVKIYCEERQYFYTEKLKK